MRLIKELFSRRWWWVSLIVIALMLVLARLGVWQLDRLQQRRAANAAIAAALNAPAVDVSSLDLSAGIPALENRLVTVAGVYDHEHQLILKVQNWQGKAGVHLITPLVIDDGDTAVLVDRGWIPDAENSPEAIMAYDVPGPVNIDGYVALSQELSRASAATPEGPQSEWYRVDIDAIQTQMPYEILPFYVIHSYESNDQLPYRTARRVELSEGSHLSYAGQWFIFSVGLGVAYLIYVNRQIQKSGDL